ncbi:MAG: phosphonate C-P lyase system protein PhnG [Methanosarcinaceae archaeon]
MNRDKRFGLIARANGELMCDIAERILADTGVDIVKKPLCGMIMMRFRDTAGNCIFNLGEVLVSEAEVRIGNSMGYAMMMGIELETALAGAILDAAVEEGHPLAFEIIGLLNNEEKRLLEEKQVKWAKVASTRVDFKVMK